MAPKEETKKFEVKNFDESPAEDQHKVDLTKDVVDLTGLTQAKAEELLKANGLNEIPQYIEPTWMMILKQFTGPMPVMIEIAFIISAAIQDWKDFAVIGALLITNASLGFHEEYKATAAMRELAEGLTPKVKVKRDGKTVEKDVTELVTGDVIFLRGGDKVPADCHFVSGDELVLDNSSLTGESRPEKRPLAGCTVKEIKQLDDGTISFSLEDKDGNVKQGLHRDQFRRVGTKGEDELSPQNGEPIKVGDEVENVEVLCGGTCKQGEAECIVDRCGLDTEIGSAACKSGKHSKGVFQEQIETACMVIIFSTLGLVIILLLVEIYVWGKPTLTYDDIRGLLLPLLALIIASVPVALPMVITVTLAMGAKKMAGESAIVTNLDALGQISDMDILCSDKTGTLTTAKMTIYRDRIWCNEGFTPEEVMLYAALASNRSNIDDPIDNAVFRAFDEQNGGPEDTEEEKASKSEAIEAQWEQQKFIGFNPIVKRTVTFTKNKETGEVLRIGKGLLDKILNTDNDGGEEWKCDNFDAINKSATEADEALGNDAFKTIAVCVQKNGGSTQFCGLLPMRDPPREDTKDTIAAVRHAGVGVKMITGDHINIARKTAEQIDLGANLHGHDQLWPQSQARDKMILHADGFAKVTPKDKLEVVSVIQNVWNITVGMTGDGVNDAPALKQANIGIAVAGATDAARASADIVLTLGGLSPIYTAILESRRIFKRLRCYILYRLACTVQIVIVLWLFGIVFNFAIPSFYIILFALICDIAALPIASDHCRPSKNPSKISIKSMFAVSISLGVALGAQGIVAYIFAILVLYADNNIYKWNIGTVIPTLIVPGFFNTDGGGPDTTQSSAGVGYENCLVTAYFYCTNKTSCGTGGANLPAPFNGTFFSSPVTPSQQQLINWVQDCQQDVFNPTPSNPFRYPQGVTSCASVQEVGVLNPMAYCQIGSGMWLQLQLACQLLLFQSRVPGYSIHHIPGWPLLLFGGIFILFVSLMVGLGGATYTPVPSEIFGWIWLYDFLFAYILIDPLKIALYSIFDPPGEEMEPDRDPMTMGRNSWSQCSCVAKLFKHAFCHPDDQMKSEPIKQYLTSKLSQDMSAEEKDKAELMKIAGQRSMVIATQRSKAQVERKKSTGSPHTMRQKTRGNVEHVDKAFSVPASSLDDRFEEALARVNDKNPEHSVDLDNSTKLQFYGLYKRITDGKCDESGVEEPSMLNFVARAKWKAWAEYDSISTDDAKLQYVSIFEEKVKAFLPTKDGQSDNSSSSTKVQGDETVEAPVVMMQQDGGLRTLTLNRPKKFNAFNWSMYAELTKQLQQASNDPSVSCILLTSSSKSPFYSSGNDILNFAVEESQLQEHAENSAKTLQAFVDSFIECKKPLIAGVNGSACGIAFTTLALCDIVYTSHDAVFWTPFSELGLSPEGCSSVMFPRIMGTSFANEVLFMGRHITGFDAKEHNLVAEVYPSQELEAKVRAKCKTLSEYPVGSLEATKRTVRSEELIAELKEVNRKECEELVKLWTSPEAMEAVMKFMNRK
eukprot:g4159.t1